MLTGHEALRTTRRPQGGWLTQLRSSLTGRVVEVASASVILATGGDQPQARLAREAVAGAPLPPRYRGKLVQSDEMLSSGGLAAIAQRLQGIAQPRIVIVRRFDQRAGLCAPAAGRSRPAVAARRDHPDAFAAR